MAGFLANSGVEYGLCSEGYTGYLITIAGHDILYTRHALTFKSRFYSRAYPRISLRKARELCT